MKSRIIAMGTAFATVSLGMVGIFAPTAQATPPASCSELFDPSNVSYVGDTSGQYSCLVPVGTSAYSVVARGGYGGSGRQLGALGAKLTGGMAVVGGSTLTVVVAGNGATGTEINNAGGSGGGYSAIIDSLGEPIVVAGGGGGDGYSGNTPNSPGGAAGAGTSGSSTGANGTTEDEYAQGGMGATDGVGGAGGLSNRGYGPGGAGGDTGVDGASAGDGSQPGGGGGGGGFGGVGGAANGSCAVTPTVGGIPGGGSTCYGGGGGGGYAGGGGGGGLPAGGRGAGGGGGSSYFPAEFTAVNTASDVSDRSPRVEFVEIMSVAGFLPTSGSTAGGTVVTINGNLFDDTAVVTLGGVACTPVTFVSPSQLTCTAGAHAAGVVDVVVTLENNQSSTVTNGFTYAESTPTNQACPLTVVKPRPAKKQLPVGQRVQLIKSATTVSQCTVKLTARVGPNVRGDVGPAARIRVNKKTGRVVVIAYNGNAKAKVQAVAVPKQTPYNQKSAIWHRSWTS